MAKKRSRLCPHCGEGVLDTISRRHKINGVIYSEKFIECSECDYSEGIKQYKDRRKDKELESESEW